MNPTFLATTSTEGLQPLGTAAQRSFELVSGTLAQRLGPQYAALFGDPVATEHGDRIDWYAPLEGVATPLPDLPEARQQALRDKLGKLIGDIRAQVDTLAASDASEDRRLSEALSNAIEVPDEAMIYGVMDADGDLHPVLVHWAWVRNEQANVRGILTGMVPRERSGTARGGAAVPVQTGTSPVWWWLILLGWLLLTAMLGAILFLLLDPCGVNRFGLVFCPVEQVAPADEFEDARVSADRIARLQHELALAERSCQPVVPILPATPLLVPDAPVVPVVPVVPGTPVAPKDQDRTEADRAKVQTRITERGAALGALNFVLEWASTDDIDLFVTCPAGETISYSNRQGCGGRYDLDANVTEKTAISDPVENIVFENAAKGLYKVRAQLRSIRTSGDKTVTLHVLRANGQSQSYTGTLGPGRDVWITNISISR